jgi:plastocyanin
MAGRALVLVVVLVAALAAPALAGARPFEGTVGPGTTITLKKANGTKLRHTTPGVHRFNISDLSGFHNFHLRGPGVGKKTGIAFVGSRTWKVTLLTGTYKFRCDAHPTTMRGSFTVS